MRLSAIIVLHQTAFTTSSRLQQEFKHINNIHTTLYNFKTNTILKMYTKTAILAALATLASASPVAIPAGEFTLISSHSGSPIVHLRGINAANRGFYINRATSAYCPPNTVANCANTQNTTTVLAAAPNTSGSLSLSVQVPGGQQVFIGPDGALGYTGPHSASVPEGSDRVGFTYTPQKTEGSVGTLNHEAGFVACPEGGEGAYRIYSGKNTVKDQSACVGVGLATSEWKGKSAWEYN